jgi:hypothetical protein
VGVFITLALFKGNKMEKIEFPKWVYHKTKDAVVVHSDDELKSLGKGWSEKPVSKLETKTQDLEQDHDS